MSGIGWLITGAVWLIVIDAGICARVLANLSRARLQEFCRLRKRPELADEILARGDAVGAAADLTSKLALATGLALLFYAQTTGRSAATASSGSSATASALESSPLLWLIGGSVAAVWLAADLLPSLLSRYLGESYLLRTWPIWNRVEFLLRPLTALKAWVAAKLARVPDLQQSEDAEQDLEQEIRSMVSAGQREGLIENDEREMIESVMELGDVAVAQIMTPRTEMVSLSVDSTWDFVLKFAGEHGHTRLPVHGKTRDEIVGILHIKDLLSDMAAGQRPRRALRAILRRPFFVPETKPVNEMLQEFQRGRTHLAIVLDEYGGVSGLITIEDVLEEIVGEIADEHDEALVDGIKQLDESNYEALARVRISDVNQRLGTSLPEEESFDTLGGYVFHELGRIPAVGETLEILGLRIKVLDANRRRIDRLSIEIVREQPPETVEAPAAAGKQPTSTAAGETGVVKSIPEG